MSIKRNFSASSMADLAVIEMALSYYWCRLRSRDDGTVKSEEEFLATATKARKDAAQRAREMLHCVRVEMQR
jgi:hypothetical protein